MNRKKSNRYRAVLIAIALVFSLLVVRITQLMFFQKNLFAATPDLTNTIERGFILDRSGEKLALSLESYSVYARPQEIESKKATAQVLARILGMEYEKILQILNRNRPFVWIRRQADATEELKNLDIPGVYVEKEFKRYYPYRNLASHVIGFSGIDQKGLEGIEYQFDDVLLPHDGVEHQRGGTVTLTIDRFIQEIVEEEIEKAYVQTGARKVTAIVMHPATGGILALANAPSYDLNDFAAVSDKVIRNKAITDSFEPGSTFKVFIASALLDGGYVTESTPFECHGSIDVEDITIHDTGVHGHINFRQVLERSCNVGMVESVGRIDKTPLYETLRNFGFGNPTGIDLPGEARGTLRNPDQWSGISKYELAIGQEIAVTPIQLITAASAIANGGVLMQPRIVKKVQRADGTTLKEYKPLEIRRVIDQDTASKLLDMLTGVLSDHGTGYKARLDGYDIAGKTGTAQIADTVNGGYLENQFYASFLGFIPVPDAKIVVLVTLDRPLGEVYGGQTAAPVFKNIVERIAPHLNILPSFSEVYILSDAS